MASIKINRTESLSCDDEAQELSKKRKKDLPMSTTTASWRRIADKTCRICGDAAVGFNFEVVSCESCKAFFRRNARRVDNIKCAYNSNCEINLSTRRFCKYCRMQKCLEVGMNATLLPVEDALVLRQRQQKERKRQARENNLKGLLAELEELEGKLQCPTCRRTLPDALLTVNVSPTSIRTPSTSSDRDSNNTCLLQKADCANSSDSVVLTAETALSPLAMNTGSWNYEQLTGTWTEMDRALMSELSNLIPHIKFYHHDDMTDPKDGNMTIENFMHMHDKQFRQLLEMFKRLHAFQLLSNNDQLNLVKESSVEVMGLRSSINYDHVSESFKPNAHADSYHISMADMQRICPEVYPRSYLFYSTWDPLWSEDWQQILLLQMLSLFNSERCQLDNKEAVDEWHNIYLNLYNKYLINKYAPKVEYARYVFQASIAKVSQFVDVKTATSDYIHMTQMTLNQVGALMAEMFGISIDQ